MPGLKARARSKNLPPTMPELATGGSYTRSSSVARKKERMNVRSRSAGATGSKPRAYAKRATNRSAWLPYLQAAIGWVEGRAWRCEGVASEGLLM